MLRRGDRLFPHPTPSQPSCGMGLVRGNGRVGLGAIGTLSWSQLHILKSSLTMKVTSEGSQGPNGRGERGRRLVDSG
jgi:hypothetical protein